jgi:carboxylate-amine ligase
MALKEPSFTIGIEEEYHLVDVDTRDLVAAPPGLISDCEKALGDQVRPEFLRSQIEVGTRVCRSLAEARAELARLRRTVARLAAAYGLAPIAAGTHPFGRPEAIEPTDEERYRAIARDLQLVVRRLATCGMHIHIGIEDDELRIDLMNQARYFLPHILALSTSSPFWQGRDSGLKCYRLAVYDELPRTGVPGRFSGWQEYEQTIGVLIHSGVIEDASKIWWDLRPSASFPTLELRITDVCTLVDDAIAIAAVWLAIVHMLFRLRRSNQSWRMYPLLLLAENRWRAQRYGVSGSLFDFGRGELVEFASLVEELLGLVSTDAAELGCETDAGRVRLIATGGTSADRQLACYARGMVDCADQRAAFQGVVDLLIRETVDQVL